MRRKQMIVFIIIILWLAIHAAKHRKAKTTKPMPERTYTKHAITAARADIKALQAQKQTLQSLANYLAFDAIPASENPNDTIRLHSQLANTYSKLAAVETKLNKAQSPV